LLEGGIQLGVPSSWRLPQAVEGLAQAENLVLLAGDDEFRRLVDVDLLQVTVVEGGLDVHVVHTPALLLEPKHRFRADFLYCLATNHGRIFLSTYRIDSLQLKKTTAYSNY
jgi:hypothetical protein